MRWDVSKNPIRLLLIAPIGGAAVFITLGVSSLLVGSASSWEQVLFFTLGGCLLSTLSIMYVVPSLTWTDIRRSVPFSYGGTLVAAIMVTVLWGYEQSVLAIICSHIVLCCVSAWLFRKTERRAFACAHCGYGLLGVHASRCPECGKERARVCDKRNDD